jgi:hypothetical protein
MLEEIDFKLSLIPLWTFNNALIMQLNRNIDETKVSKHRMYSFNDYIVAPYDNKKIYDKDKELIEFYCK